MAIIRTNFYHTDPRNHSFTTEQLQEGLRLEMIVTAHLTDEAAMEAATKKAGFGQDSVGQWFIQKGTVTTIDRLTLEKVTGPNVIHVPTPAALTAGVSQAEKRRQESTPGFGS